MSDRLALVQIGLHAISWSENGASSQSGEDLWRVGGVGSADCFQALIQQVRSEEEIHIGESQADIFGET